MWSSDTLKVSETILRTLEVMEMDGNGPQLLPQRSHFTVVFSSEQCKATYSIWDEQLYVY